LIPTGKRSLLLTRIAMGSVTSCMRLTARLDEQAAQIQNVNAQLEASKPAPQVVNNP